MTDYDRGRSDFRHMLASLHYAGVDRAVASRIAIKMFWPPATEANLQIARPLDQDRADWMRGFDDERRGR